MEILFLVLLYFLIYLFFKKVHENRKLDNTDENEKPGRLQR